MLKIGDKIKYVNANPFIEFPLGTICKVTNIKDTAIEIVGNYKVNNNIIGTIQGVMSYDEYEKYFEKSFEQIYEWSEWKTKRLFCEECSGCHYNVLCSFSEHSDISYKHNNKKVLVSVQLEPNYLYPNAPKGKVLRAYASCHPNDKFDLQIGIQVALNKIEKQIAKQVINKANEIIKSY